MSLQLKQRGPSTFFLHVQRPCISGSQTLDPFTVPGWWQVHSKIDLNLTSACKFWLWPDESKVSFHFHFYVGVRYYISLYVGEYDWSFIWAREMVMWLLSANVWFWQLLILIRMAYKVLISPRCDIWHQLTWSVCTGGRKLRHNQIFSDE